MARFTPSALVGSISGTIGGVTFQSDGVVKTKQRAKAPNIKLQSDDPVLDPTSQTAPFWNLLSVLHPQFIALSESNRAQWESAASLYPRYNPTAGIHNITAWNLFVMFNSSRLYLTSTILETPPFMTALPAPSDFRFKIGPGFTMRFIIPVTPTNSNARLHILGGRPFRQYALRNHKYWKFIIISTVTSPASDNFLTQYEYKLGDLTPSERVQVKYRLIATDQMPSQWMTADAPFLIA